MEDNNILDQEVIEEKHQERRRQLLPWWIKTFIWIFIVFGALAIVGIAFGLLGLHFQLAIYGLSSTLPLSAEGILITVIFIFKGVVAIALWTEKDWAVPLGIIDAIAGICICGFVFLVMPFLDKIPGFHISFRLELFLLIPFLVKLLKIREPWNKLKDHERIYGLQN